MGTKTGTGTEQRMTSLDIAQVTGKPHNDVLKAIRKMEPAWEKVHQGNFSRMQIRKDLPNGGYRLIPVFSLTKKECLYVSTKFNDEARALLVKRWYELECEKLGVKIPEPKLLVTEQEIIRKGDEIRRSEIASENAGADGCLTVSQIAEMLQITVKELNKQLVAEGVQYWNGGRYKLTPRYADSGLAKERSFHYYALDGEKKERKYLVWTAEGVEFIRQCWLVGGVSTTPDPSFLRRGQGWSEHAADIPLFSPPPSPSSLDRRSLARQELRRGNKRSIKKCCLSCLSCRYFFSILAHGI